ncbi:hypothetical protein WJX84_005989 [Apatococcus fuscideae]|uniref:Uncharacterized protein n=1 Tax=Apatococcus fuscideae TaxID=2026836 RepID=A0AAW1TEU8_9CHLO
MASHRYTSICLSTLTPAPQLDHLPGDSSDVCALKDKLSSLQGLLRAVLSELIKQKTNLQEILPLQRRPCNGAPRSLPAEGALGGKGDQVQEYIGPRVASSQRCPSKRKGSAPADPKTPRSLRAGP